MSGNTSDTFVKEDVPPDLLKTDSAYLPYEIYTQLNFVPLTVAKFSQDDGIPSEKHAKAKTAHENAGYLDKTKKTSSYGDPPKPPRNRKKRGGGDEDDENILREAVESWLRFCASCEENGIGRKVGHVMVPFKKANNKNRPL